MTVVQTSRQRSWLGLVLISLLLSLTACSNTTPTPVPAAASPTLPPTQPIVAKTAATTQPQTTIDPGLTPAITPTALSATICQPTDLTIVSDWSVSQEKSGDYSLKAEVKFTNNSPQTCTLPPFSKGQFFDSNGQPVITTLFFGNIKVTALSLSSDHSSTQLASKQTYTTFINIDLIDKCGTPLKPSEQGKPGFNIQLTFGSSTTLVVPGLKMDHVEQAKEHLFDCIGPVTFTPLEAIAGSYYTAKANRDEVTAIAYQTAQSANWKATLTATPPTPTPTAIPTIIAGTKPCQAENLSYKHTQANGIMAGQQSFSFILINNGANACTLQGFPVFQVVDAAGNLVPGALFTQENYQEVDTEPKHKFIPLTPNNADAPLINMLPGKAAQLGAIFGSCTYNKPDNTPPKGTLKMILPDNGSEVNLGENSFCYLRTGYFHYAPDDWQRQFTIEK